MSLTYGFYNSVNQDRKYNAEQMSALFNGIINDGVFQSLGTCLMVTANTGLTVNVGLGRAWFKGTWTNNDAILPLTLAQAEVAFNRIDVIALEVNTSDAVRANDIKVIKGTPASSPVAPTLTHTDDINQYPLAHIYVAAQTTNIIQANITNKVGTASCPFVTGILQTMSIDAIVAQWESEFDTWNSTKQTEFTAWETLNKDDFEAWLAYIKALFGSDPAGSLQNQVDDLDGRIDTLEAGVITLDSRLDGIDLWKHANPVTTAGTGTVLTATIPGLVLVDGTTIRVKLHEAIGAGATLNVNAGGAIPILNSKGIGTQPGAVAGSYLTLIYNGTSFILQGEGGDSESGVALIYGKKPGQISAYELWNMGYSPYYRKGANY